MKKSRRDLNITQTIAQIVVERVSSSVSMAVASTPPPLTVKDVMEEAGLVIAQIAMEPETQGPIIRQQLMGLVQSVMALVRLVIVLSVRGQDYPLLDRIRSV